MSPQNVLRAILLPAVVVAIAIGAGVGLAATSLKIMVPAGSTTVELDGMQVQIDSTEPVVVQLYVADGSIVGQVDPAPGVRAADVTLTVLGTPSVVIFSGKVTSITHIEQYFFTQETGRGEG